MLNFDKSKIHVVILRLTTKRIKNDYRRQEKRRTKNRKNGTKGKHMLRKRFKDKEIRNYTKCKCIEYSS